MRLSGNIPLYLIVFSALILLVTILLRFPLVANGFFAFTHDQGRDLLAVREIVEEKNFTLIGPTTGLPGAFYGPWWYYYLSPIFLLTQGDPTLVALSFAFLGTITVLLIAGLSYALTKNIIVSLLISLISAMSQPFITASTQIWSPSLIPPLMIIYIYSIFKIFKSSHPKWYFLLGLSCGLVLESEAAFGFVLTLATLITGIFFKKYFFKKSTFLFFAALLIIFAPRILFDVRNDFLITKSVFSWLTKPEVFQEELTLVQRFINRLDLLYLNFAQTFAKGNKILAIIPLTFFLISTFLMWSKLRNIKTFKFLLIVIFFIYLGFVIYPDAIWDYYLSGLPPLLVLLLAVSSAYFFKSRKTITAIALILISALNFKAELISPFQINWEGDGSVYRNQIGPLKDISQDLQGDYSVHAYSPAGQDYPFQYILNRLEKKGAIAKPKTDQKNMILIIRDDPQHNYLILGWYGDKTRDNTKVLERKEYPGSIIIEKHLKNE